jgi:SulP family sulfate permease
MAITSTAGLNLRHWRGDLMGGFTAAVVALPLALAFGVASGAGPMAGLYGAPSPWDFWAPSWGVPLPRSQGPPDR